MTNGKQFFFHLDTPEQAEPKTIQEIRGAIASHWEQADKDHSHFLTSTEYQNLQRDIAEAPEARLFIISVEAGFAFYTKYSTVEEFAAKFK